MDEQTATTGTGGAWAGIMHSGGVDSRGQMIWHYGPLSECWCRASGHRCNHVCPEHPAAPTPGEDER